MTALHQNVLEVFDAPVENVVQSKKAIHKIARALDETRALNLESPTHTTLSAERALALALSFMERGDGRSNHVR